MPSEGYTSAEFTCSYSPNLLEVSNIQVASLFGPDTVSVVNGPGAQSFIIAIAASDGNKATTSGTVFTFNVKGLQVGQTVIECKARVSQGNNTLAEIPFVTDTLTILGGTPTPTATQPAASDTPTSTPGSSTNTPTPTNIPGGSTSTPTSTRTSTATPGSDWIAYTNLKYGFRFLYPKEGQIAAGATDNFVVINLPFQPGTNLGHKYLQVDVVENADPCRSPVAASSIVTSSQTVMINGISFFQEIGAEPAAGNLYQFVAYSTLRDNVCVSLSFVLHSLNPGNFATPPAVFDYAAETAVFGQIVGTYTWLDLPTATPTGLPTETATSTPMLNGTSTQTSTATPTSTPTSTSTSSQNGTVAGQITVSKPVTVNIYDSNMILVATTESADGNFSLEVAPGNYTVVAVAPGFLSAQRTVTITTGVTDTLPPLTMLAGDLDANNVIDQFDALTIGMSYNAAVPDAADLNDDGIINVLDLELLAKNYRKTGPTPW